MKSALIYDCISLALASDQWAPKGPYQKILVFDCALEDAKKNRIKVPLNILNVVAHIDGVKSPHFSMVRQVARSCGVSLGDKSTSAIAICLQQSHVLVSSDPCVCNIAASLNLTTYMFKGA